MTRIAPLAETRQRTNENYSTALNNEKQRLLSELNKHIKEAADRGVFTTGIVQFNKPLTRDHVRQIIEPTGYVLSFVDNPSPQEKRAVATGEKPPADWLGEYKPAPLMGGGRFRLSWEI